MDALRILHLSDIHYGYHQFDPPHTPSGPNASSAGYRSLVESLKGSLGGFPPHAVVISGDITQRARSDEFEPAAQLLTELAALTGGPERLFLVPGNHDVVYTEAKVNPRWTPFCDFYNNFFQQPANKAAQRPFISSNNPEQLTQVIDRSAELGLVVVEINSSTFVHKGSDDEHRGKLRRKPSVESMMTCQSWRVYMTASVSLLSTIIQSFSRCSLSQVASMMPF